MTLACGFCNLKTQARVLGGGALFFLRKCFWFQPRRAGLLQGHTAGSAHPRKQEQRVIPVPEGRGRGPKPNTQGFSSWRGVCHPCPSPRHTLSLGTWECGPRKAADGSLPGHTGDTALPAPRPVPGHQTRGRVSTSQLCELLGTSLQPIWEAQDPSVVTQQAPHLFPLEHTIPHSSSNALVGSRMLTVETL